MKDFLLNQNKGLEFDLFNGIHLIILIITYIFVLLVLFNKNKIYNITNKQKNTIQILTGLILSLFYVFRRGSFLTYGVYNWRVHLDLGFCNMTNILFIIYCFTKNKKIYNICYYCAFCGPLLSILFPVLNVDINNFSFINFIVIHNGIFLMNLVFAIIEEKKFEKEKLLFPCCYIFIFVVVTYIFNFIFKTNYNFLTSFVSTKLYNVQLVNLVCNNYIISFIVMVIIGTLCILTGIYFLKLLNEGGNKIE